MFNPDTLVQHYLQPEEMKPFYLQALEHTRQQQREQQGSMGVARGRSSDSAAAGAGPVVSSSSSSAAQQPQGSDAAGELYAQLVQMGLLRR